ncbi:hypothetical protein V2E39_16045 [Chryseobacterium arthrosphaerae]|uniref:Lipoprotein n=1 Tax=Chryseobacterium arthrosphaerae TaxID=651561 RepID=A0ABU7R2P3_9FLAO|nr:hypothetical protein [Chryseobacterium arthrosphaerae]AYZ13620.1 hypothetical protein EGY05_17465 [Chryseobacterium arthrosphaerae]MDG4654575.1 hypothetical protein [Chryseobacterium arthrosphaerae]QUY54446.1 hypothetical protein I2F65_16360 [Chryseobacterium arthrosphaerae]
MKKILSYTSVLVLSTTLTLVSCNTSKNLNTNLPVDIADRPIDEDSQKYDQAQLDKLKASIESEVSGLECKDATEWTFAPMGTKACGGPQQYIAYPKKIEETFLPRVNEYTDKVRVFNEKYNIVSDCMAILPPTSLKCIKGKIRLITADNK